MATEAIAEAVAALRAGAVVCIPTETSYGLAVNPFSSAALARLCAVKGRPENAPFALIAADVGQVDALVQAWPDGARGLAERHWPGPLTLVLPARPDLAPEIVGSGGGVGVRVSSHPQAAALARAFGQPITATSANPSGAPAATSVERARSYFGDQVAVYLDGGPSSGERPSTVLAIAADGSRTVLRAGPVDVS